MAAARFYRRRIAGSIFLRIAVSLSAVAVLAACSSVAQMAGGPATETAAAASLSPAEDQFGTGPLAVGVLAFEEPGNLSDGAPNSVYLAAKLAATTLSGNPITVIVRTVTPGSGAVTSAVEDLNGAGARIVLGLNDEAAAMQVAKGMAAAGAPTISLTSFSDLAVQLYGAGYVPSEEAVALVNEAARRGHTSLAVVTTEGKSSQDFTRAVLSLAAAAGINARPVDGSTDSQFVAGMTALAAAGVPVSAIVFASGPIRAGAMMSMLRDDGRFKSVTVIGNSGWALAGRLPGTLKGAWYTSVAGEGLAKFAESFRAANGTVATLNAAMTYDLIVLAAALPQTVGEEPYNPELLTNSQGFKGFTGPFRFGPSGMLAARSYTIVTVR